MSVFIKNSVIILIVFLAIGSFLHAETNNPRFEVVVDRANLGLDDILHLNITMHNTQNFEAPKLPEINGFKSRYVGPSTMMSIVNGKSSSSVTHLYRLIPLRKGTFTIPSIAVDYDGQSFSSTPIEVEVVNAKQSKKDDFSIPQEAQSQLEDRIFLMLEVQKKTAYINEKIPVKMKLYVGRLAVRDVQYPQINLEGFSSEPIKKPKQYPEVLRGMTYDVLEFSTNIYAVKPGNFNIGPAKTRCSIVMRKQSFRRRSSLFDDFFGEDVFNDFFGKYETYPFDLASQTDSVIIMPLPKKGRPETFSGAVGSFSFDMDAEPKSVKVGDPITVKYFVTGNGNLSTVSSPQADLSGKFKTYPPETTMTENGRMFEQVLIPTDSAVDKIPQVSFSFFDPEKGFYRTITRGPVPIFVKPQEEAEAARMYEYSKPAKEVVKKEALGKDIIYIKAKPDTFKKIAKSKNSINRLLGINLSFFILFMFFVISHKRRERISSDDKYAHRIHASMQVRRNIKLAQKLIEKNNVHGFYSIIFKTMQEYIAGRVHRPAAGITADILEELKNIGIPEDVIDMAKEIFNQCDIARFSAASLGKPDMKAAYDNLTKFIDKFNRHKI